ncbi:10041_t:CDS:2 [Ambispora leptoticha]|uniref:10041_t:CDS:1 n=1 Tax=Ambispora leptoticha TaxID=144679 RepID=A0A9N9BW11_9GLOM|nr:10041_t:CDS:2 [Ambispora leptoticha]
MVENSIFEFEVATPSGDRLQKLITEYVDKKECRTPPNSFFIYRQLLIRELHSSGLNLQAVAISRLASKNWKTKPANVKAVFRDAAQTKTARKLDYPNSENQEFASHEFLFERDGADEILNRQIKSEPSKLGRQDGKK